ncbi:NmrA/HSCARG family protein [Maribacter halichondriae]|uniref:NmrA/HSCARG family protein n=1 Tax=Maribacter halichondriae TaxID=2980554 RepID=UPI00235A0EBA|nr:NmrA/HSCARG family protein [Maribacter sp. Hal144]
MEKQKTIFVTGITGNQGGAVARHLLRENQAVIGLTRNSNSEKAKQLKAQGATIVEGNLDDPSTFQSDLDKVDAIFLVQALQGKDNEIRQGKGFIDNLKPQNNIHLVYASVLGADLDTGVPHFESKFELEKYIKSKDLKYTILRPASFYENHLFPRVASDIRKGKYISPLIKSCKQQMIGVDVIGKIAAKVISNSENYMGKTLSLATDEWSIEEIPQLFSEAINKPVKYKKLPSIITRLAMGKDLAKMFKYMNKQNFSGVENIDTVRDEFEIKENFKSWVLEHFKID